MARGDTDARERLKCVLLGASIGIGVESLAQELDNEKHALHSPGDPEPSAVPAIKSRVVGLAKDMADAWRKCGIGPSDPVRVEWERVADHFNRGELYSGDAALESLAEMLSEGKQKKRVEV